MDREWAAGNFYSVQYSVDSHICTECYSWYVRTMVKYTLYLHPSHLSTYHALNRPLVYPPLPPLGQPKGKLPTRDRVSCLTSVSQHGWLVAGSDWRAVLPITTRVSGAASERGRQPDGAKRNRSQYAVRAPSSASSRWSRCAASPTKRIATGGHEIMAWTGYCAVCLRTCPDKRDEKTLSRSGGPCANPDQ